MKRRDYSAGPTVALALAIILGVFLGLAVALWFCKVFGVLG